MPSPYNYYCQKCDFSGSTMTAWGIFIYQKGEIEIPININIGICYECEMIAPVEKLPDEKYLSKLGKKTNYIANKLFEEEKKRKQLLSSRASKARCLKCSSHNFNVIPTINTETQVFNSGKPTSTGLKHKNCGGYILVKKTSTNFYMGDKLPTKFYNIEGLEITDIL